MNAKTIAIAIALIAGTAVVSSVQASESIKTLSTVQVRPAADQLAQQAWEQASGIPTLATVEVRPSADQLAERNGYVAAPVAAAIRPWRSTTSRRFSSRSVCGTIFFAANGSIIVTWRWAIARLP